MTENQTVAPELFAPKAPLAFVRPALRGAWSAAALQFLLGWLVFQSLTSLGWAHHLRRLTGSSSLPTYWGEFITSRDVWELLEHGGLRHHPLGLWTTLAAVLSLSWLLWFGWRMQAAAAGVRPGFLPWLRGLLEAILLALPPLLLLRAAVLWILAGLASTGIQPLGWLQVVGSALLHVTLGGVFMAQWWLCRLDLARPAAMRSPMEGVGRHLIHSFLRLWQHPIHWGALSALGGLLRGGLFLSILGLAWRWGGGSVARVLLVSVLLALATLVNAAIIGWVMRLAAHFWRHDRRVRDEVQNLQRQLEA